MLSDFFRRINRGDLICAKDAACSQNSARSSVPQGQAGRVYLLCLTNTALQASDEVRLPATLHENSFLRLTTRSILKQHGRPPR